MDTTLSLEVEPEAAVEPTIALKCALTAIRANGEVPAEVRS